jgi:hypothetical protein
MQAAGYEFTFFRDACQPQPNGTEMINPACYVHGWTLSERLEYWGHDFRANWKASGSLICGLELNSQCNRDEQTNAKH